LTLSDRLDIEVDIMQNLHQPVHENVTRLLEVISHGKLRVHVYENLLGGNVMHSSPASSLYSANTGKKPRDLGSVNYEVFTAAAAARNLHQIASGLRYLHNQHIVHKDISPENVVITQPFDTNQDCIQPRELSFPEAESATSSSSRRFNNTPEKRRCIGKSDDDSNGSGGCGFAGFFSKTSAFGSVGYPILKICDFNQAEKLNANNSRIYSAEGAMPFRPPESMAMNTGDTCDSDCEMDDTGCVDSPEKNQKESFKNTEGGIDGYKRDLWSVGVMLYLMCFGVSPFGRDATTTISVQLAIMAYSNEIEWPQWFLDGLNLAAEDAGNSGRNDVAFLYNNIKSLLERDPRKRNFFGL